MYAGVVHGAAQALAGPLAPDGSWPSFLAAGWLGAAVLFHAGLYYESARIQVVLAERMPEMSPADVAWLAAALRRVGMAADDWLLVAARRRLAETQRTRRRLGQRRRAAFDVHTTLAAIRALPLTDRTC